MPDLDAAEIAKLLRQRWPLADIYANMAAKGVQAPVVKRVIADLNREWREHARSDFETMKGRELMQLDSLENEVILWCNATTDDESRARFALTRLKLMERRARMMGLDSPLVVMNNAVAEEAKRLGIDAGVLMERVMTISGRMMSAEPS